MGKNIASRKIIMSFEPNIVPLEMVAIPGGTFLMGSPKGEGYISEKPQHKVVVPPFWMSKHPITQAQWKEIAALAPIAKEIYPNPSRFKFKGDNRPVESISFYDAVEFCERLSALSGKPYELPSEAQWEYACRAGTTTRYHFGNAFSPELANCGNIFDDNGMKTTPVGQFPPNAFGLYDMHGNVLEWCVDDWHENYEGAPSDGTAWINYRQDDAVLRGGSWFSHHLNCRSAARDYDDSHSCSDGLYGFRVVCEDC